MSTTDHSSRERARSSHYGEDRYAKRSRRNSSPSTSPYRLDVSDRSLINVTNAAVQELRQARASRELDIMKDVAAADMNKEGAMEVYWAVDAV